MRLSACVGVSGVCSVFDLNGVSHVQASGYELIENGHVIGHDCTQATVTTHAFIFNGNDIQKSGTLPPASKSSTYAINDFGQITSTAEWLALQRNKRQQENSVGAASAAISMNSHIASG